MDVSLPVVVVPLSQVIEHVKEYDDFDFDDEYIDEFGYYIEDYE